MSYSLFSFRFAAPTKPGTLGAFALLCFASACGAAVKPLPAATAQDPQLEAQAKRAVYGARDFTGASVVDESDKILDARIVSDFQVEQNQLTGAPTKRSVAIALVVKEADGRCRWVTVQFSQQHMGGGTYGGLQGEMPLEQSEMQCPAEGATPSAAPLAAGAQPAAFSTPQAAPAPQNEAEQQAQIDAIVDGMGPNAASECKAYIRQVCNTQKGAGAAGVQVCKAYADTMRDVANSPDGATSCKQLTGGRQ